MLRACRQIQGTPDFKVLLSIYLAGGEYGLLFFISNQEHLQCQFSQAFLYSYKSRIFYAQPTYNQYIASLTDILWHT